jgi:hypothetical protein
MQSFSDNKGRRWTIEITISAVGRVRAVTGLNLAFAGDDNCRMLGQILSDPSMLFAVICAIIKPQLTAQGISEEELGDAIGGDSLEKASEAFTEALTDFFPSEKQRKAAKGILALMRTAHEKKIQEVMAKIEEIRSRVDAGDLTSLSGDLPESSASTPAT